MLKYIKFNKTVTVEGFTFQKGFYGLFNDGGLVCVYTDINLFTSYCGGGEFTCKPTIYGFLPTESGWAKVDDYCLPEPPQELKDKAERLAREEEEERHASWLIMISEEEEGL